MRAEERTGRPAAEVPEHGWARAEPSAARRAETAVPGSAARQAGGAGTRPAGAEMPPAPSGAAAEPADLVRAGLALADPAQPDQAGDRPTQANRARTAPALAGQRD